MSKRSVARGNVHGLSDIDLLIVADFQGSRRDRVEQSLDIAQGLKLTFPVEPLRSDPKSTSRRASAPSSATSRAKRWKFRNRFSEGSCSLWNSIGHESEVRETSWFFSIGSSVWRRRSR
jgi:hypothetical protein